MLKIVLSLSILFFFSACSEQKEPQEKKSSSMKCGAGKCGANMIDGNSGVDKKKKDFLAQMKDDDPRASCVMSAKSVKEIYDCVRNAETQRLQLHTQEKQESGSMKCGGAMKCAAGKCG